jgi:hypothetical protein
MFNGCFLNLTIRSDREAGRRGERERGRLGEGETKGRSDFATLRLCEKTIKLGV